MYVEDLFNDRTIDGRNSEGIPAIADGKAKKVDNILDAIRESYDLVTDEFLNP